MFTTRHVNDMRMRSDAKAPPTSTCLLNMRACCQCLGIAGNSMLPVGEVVGQATLVSDS